MVYRVKRYTTQNGPLGEWSTGPLDSQERALEIATDRSKDDMNAVFVVVHPEVRRIVMFHGLQRDFCRAMDMLEDFERDFAASEEA